MESIRRGIPVYESRVGDIGGSKGIKGDVIDNIDFGVPNLYIYRLYFDY